MKYWKKLSWEERKARIENALQENVNYHKDAWFGYPASSLDEQVFDKENLFLRGIPMIQAYLANPNHIGCHTFGDSEKAFHGTHELEREALRIIAVDILGAEDRNFDGYVSAGGTEANIQALWIYRNYFLRQRSANLNEIAILCSEDTHYSIPKGANLLMIDLIKIPVDTFSRTIQSHELDLKIQEAIQQGKKYFIVVSNMGTTMFGSVDDPQIYAQALEKYNVEFKLHVDAAYGGFVYPFACPDNHIHFKNPIVSSITVDAHKVLQAPYGTGIFLCRKGLIKHALTKEAEYIEGFDLTLSGSRSGANAVAVWYILTAYGPHRWYEKIHILNLRTDWLCNQLHQLNVPFFRQPCMNMVTIRSEAIPKFITEKYHLVPQKHVGENLWYKIVLMEHVQVEQLMDFINDLQAYVEEKTF